MKKKIGWLFLLSILCLNAYADLIDQPVASIFLTKNEFITSMQVQEKMQLLQSFGKQAGVNVNELTKKKVLDSIIDEMLLYQAAERDGVKITENELSKMVQSNKESVEKQLNSPITDEQFKQLIKQQAGLSWEEYRKNIEQQYIQQTYIVQAKKDVLEAIPQPTEAEIQASFDSNAQNLVNPKFVKLYHIYVSTLNLDSEGKTKAKENINNIHNMLKQGKQSFEKIAEQYSEDTTTKYKQGLIGYVAINDANAKNTFGADTFKEIFNMQSGEVKGILESPSGFHIFKITDVVPAKMLSLDDNVRPDSKTTVREYLKATLFQDRQQKAIQQAVLDLIQELRDKAEIKILDPAYK
ncbi:MAG: peptidylprolyl isomerase [Spirochaetales bacterium]|nr:peptidylprolyl isomerase [Spirochaetales bacterium]